MMVMLKGNGVVWWGLKCDGDGEDDKVLNGTRRNGREGIVGNLTCLNIDQCTNINQLESLFN